MEVKMATVIITCSIPIELSEFLNENPDLSPSKILQQKIFEIKADEAKLQTRLKAYEIRNSSIRMKLDRICKWAEEQNIDIPNDVLA